MKQNRTASISNRAFKFFILNPNRQGSTIGVHIMTDEKLSTILARLVAMVTGQQVNNEIQCKPVGGITISEALNEGIGKIPFSFFKSVITANKLPDIEVDPIVRGLEQIFEHGKKQFLDYYNSNQKALHTQIESLAKCGSTEERAKIITHLFMPELNLSDEDILLRWRLTEVKPNPEPITPQEVVLQLNGLYSPPSDGSPVLTSNLTEAWSQIQAGGLTKIADYDHPVPLFEKDENHELLKCLHELDSDMAFEISRGVLPADYQMPVLISVSVTHKEIDSLCGRWIEELLRQNQYKHLRCMVLTEEKTDRLKSELFSFAPEVFSVMGKYGRHFNALKYMQLLFEKAWHIRAGFKLDTDEGIRSQECFEKTGKTWLQILCHPLWGGTATDCHGQKVVLGVNEGEYVNIKDIQALGYAAATRTPDVSVPSKYGTSQIFLNKGFAHGRCTSLYNQFDHLSDHVSHPVVKGGGYGITNDALKCFTPFTFSEVGRAEDQQFYFSAVAGGCRGIFHPDLRIAHYKSEGSAAAKAEERTVVSRYVGDLYRLIIFSHLVEILPDVFGAKDKKQLKYDIDPMPGVFAGKFARLQAVLSLAYQTVSHIHQGHADRAELLISDGVQQLTELIRDIDTGKIARQLKAEYADWQNFVRQVESFSEDRVRTILEQLMV